MSKSAAVITSPILSPAPDLPADERLALVMQDIDRSIKSNITTYLAKKMGGSTVGDVYSKTVKPSHKSEKTAAYEKPWFSRPFTALDDTQKHYLRANIADFVFGKVLTYLDPSCAAKGRIGVVRATSADSAGDKGGVNLYSQEITGFISRHILRWKGGRIWRTSGCYRQASYCAFFGAINISRGCRSEHH